MKPLTFQAPLFPGRIKVFFSLEDFNNADPSTIGKSFDGYDAFFWERKIGHCIVFINYSDNALAHEAVHCAWNLLENAGVKVTHDNDEPLAYLVDKIFKKVAAHRAKELANG